MSGVVQGTVFEWRASVSAEAARKERMTLLALFAPGIASVGWAVIGLATGAGANVRFLIVLGAMLIGLGVHGLMSSRQLRSTVVQVDRSGTLTVADPKRSHSLDLRTASTLAIRHRNARPQWKWSIEVIHQGGAWHADLPGLATYWNLDADVIGALETDLQRWLAWANQHQRSTPPHPADVPSETATPYGSATTRRPTDAIPVQGAVANRPGRFEWQPPRHPNQARNRLRFRIGVTGVVVLVAVIAAVSEAQNGLAAVLFSMFVPALILLIGFGIDRVYDIGRRFRIRVDAAGLSIQRSSKPPTTIPASDIGALQVTLSHEATHDPHLESSNWYLTVTRRNGELVRTALPLYLGTSFHRNDAIALEAELRRRLGVTNSPAR